MGWSYKDKPPSIILDIAKLTVELMDKVKNKWWALLLFFAFFISLGYMDWFSNHDNPKKLIYSVAYSLSILIAFGCLLMFLTVRVSFEQKTSMIYDVKMRNLGNNSWREPWYFRPYINLASFLIAFLPLIIVSFIWFTGLFFFS